MNPFRLSPSQHILSFASAVLIAGTLFSSVSVSAQTQPTYRAELVQPQVGRVAAAGVAWNCNGSTCTAGQSNSRPAIVCARLVREIGPVASFTVSGEALSAEQLARCNAAAS